MSFISFFPCPFARLFALSRAPARCEQGEQANS
jgi:hypothetical protein